MHLYGGIGIRAAAQTRGVLRPPQTEILRGWAVLLTEILARCSSL